MRFSRYDAVLLAIPTAMTLGVVASTLQPVTLTQGIASGAVVSTLLLYEALFRHPPTRSAPTNVAAIALVTVQWLTTVVLSL